MLNVLKTKQYFHYLFFLLLVKVLSSAFFSSFIGQLPIASPGYSAGTANLGMLSQNVLAKTPLGGKLEETRSLLSELSFKRADSKIDHFKTIW